MILAMELASGLIGLGASVGGEVLGGGNILGEQADTSRSRKSNGRIFIDGKTDKWIMNG